MIPAIELDGAKVYHGDCREILRGLADNSVDSIVTDPPYELGFMGKKWDSSGIAYDVDVWQQCLRVLKPGGHLLAFGGSRTFHRLAVAIEDAGYEIRDTIAWISSKTFPKSLNVSKAIDKKLGAERKVVGKARGARNGNGKKVDYGNFASANDGYYDVTLASSPEARKWQGWGTGLKQVVEPVVLARKPIEGTVADNFLRWGVGGLNIDASRIGDEQVTINTFDNGAKPFGNAVGEAYTSRVSTGRWPANVMLDEAAANTVDEQSGNTKDGVAVRRNGNSGTGLFPVRVAKNSLDVGYGGYGGASRFFYVATASKKDRNEGLDTQNTHPTVKPVALMQYLIRLITPPGGLVLDPFTGSGSTGKAALLDGYQFVGAELTDEYLPIIESRLKWALDNRDEALF